MGRYPNKGGKKTTNQNWLKHRQWSGWRPMGMINTHRKGWLITDGRKDGDYKGVANKGGLLNHKSKKVQWR